MNVRFMQYILYLLGIAATLGFLHLCLWCRRFVAILLRDWVSALPDGTQMSTGEIDKYNTLKLVLF